MKKHRDSYECKGTSVKMTHAHMASCFHTMKTEWIRGWTFATITELEAALTAYIRLYTHHRLRSGIDDPTPEHHERLVA